MRWNPGRKAVDRSRAREGTADDPEADVAARMALFRVADLAMNIPAADAIVAADSGDWLQSDSTRPRSGPAVVSRPAGGLAPRRRGGRRGGPRGHRRHPGHRGDRAGHHPWAAGLGSRSNWKTTETR
jgi:hypothetical protein